MGMWAFRPKGDEIFFPSSGHRAQWRLNFNGNPVPLLMPVLKSRISWLILTAICSLFVLSPVLSAAGGGGHGAESTIFPRPLADYHEPEEATLMQVLVSRAKEDPINLVAAVLFLCAILHTFSASTFNKWAHEAEVKFKARQADRIQLAKETGEPYREEVSFKAGMLHFLGEVEVIFGIWCIPLLIAITISQGWPTARDYVAHRVNYTEPAFVVVIMAMAATRPILRLAENLMAFFAKFGKSTPAAWWFSILTIGPILGSFITEPAAMTICALLLSSKFYNLNPSLRLSYATLGILFVNVSVGGTLTHFAAPPVLMVAGKWGWDMPFMLSHFGWKAIIGILISTVLYFMVFRKELSSLRGAVPDPEDKKDPSGHESPWIDHDWPVPVWITVAHVLFMAWTVFNAHYIPLFIAGFLVFIAFTTLTSHHQENIKLKPAMLVGFFLAGLVTFGTVQQWWIAPVLGELDTFPLFVGSTVLTAFNDNAAITYLASLVPTFTDEMKYAVVAGAVTGGGLTVIANAPNPAGQSILQRFFGNGISPLGLVAGAMIPTIILGACYILL